MLINDHPRCGRGKYWKAMRCINPESKMYEFQRFQRADGKCKLWQDGSGLFDDFDDEDGSDCKDGEIKYDDKTVLAYVGEYITHAQDVIGHQFTVAELDMIGSLVSSVQASYRNFDIFTDEAMTARMMKQAEKIDEQLDDAMFYCAYKINSGLLRCCMEHFPEKKELAYTIVARMNKHQERYDGIEFVGKDRRHG